MYKFETHCHTAESSNCGHVPAEQVVELYLRQGYDGIVITDHFFPDDQCHSLEKQTVDFEARVQRLFAGYRAAKEKAFNRIVVLPGMELRFRPKGNDYLVYGITEEWLMQLPEIFSWGINRFSKYARNKGLLIGQAHPFRNGTTIIDPSLVDMIEIYNGHPRHASRNEIAKHWAEMHGLLHSSGSDFHRVGDEGTGGVVLPDKPETIQHFVTLMRQAPTILEK